jgi:hypothetical protein
VCPQTYVLNDELNDRFNYKVSIGNWIKVASTQAKSEEILSRATDGGSVTAILNYLLDYNYIDGAIVAKKEGPFNRIPFFAKTKEDLVEAAGSHYDISGHVVKLEHYTTFIPTITELKKLIGSDMMNVAVVGTPCQIHSIRKMQELSIVPAHVIKYALGLFCNLNFSFDETDREKMENKFNFSFENVEKMNIKEDMMLKLDEGDKCMYSLIIESEEGSKVIRQYGGEENILKSFIILDGSVFRGGGTVVLPQRYSIKKVPEDLKLLRRSINIDNFKRYSALCEEGEMKDKWEELIEKAEDILSISSLRNVSSGKLGELFPDRIYNKEDKDNKEIIEENIDEESEYLETEDKFIIPTKHYFSFISVEEDWHEKLIPVILHLSPLDERIFEIQKKENEIAIGG